MQIVPNAMFQMVLKVYTGLTRNKPKMQFIIMRKLKILISQNSPMGERPLTCMKTMDLATLGFACFAIFQKRRIVLL